MTKQKKYAIVFAGQGAQKSGMGKSLYEKSEAARQVFDAAGDDIKYDCFEADAERLRQTEVTQPAVYTMDMAAYAALRETLGADFPPPFCVAGFSLGEYAAFTAAGVIGSVEEGVSLVKKRSLLMKEAGTNPDGSPRGSMAAGMGEKSAVLALVERTREGGVLEAVNFNSPQQTVVAGDIQAIERFTALAKEDRSFGVKAIPLSVSGAFHSPLMEPAADGFAEELKNYTFYEPEITVYLNITGGRFDDYPGQGADAKTKEIMARQIKTPVQWQRTMEAMTDAGVETIIEVGPGKTLSGLAKKTIPGIMVLNVEEEETLATAAAHLKESV